MNDERAVAVLAALQQQGFTFARYEAYARHLGVTKHNCVALLELTSEGCWKQFSSAGYLLDGQIALLVEHAGQPVFVHKSKSLPAEGEPLENFRRFTQELRAILESQ